MALLDATNRFRVFAQAMRDMPGVLTGVTKTQLQSAVDATDQWIEDNQTSYNNALPAAVKNNATLVQKTFLFCYVAMRRAGRLQAEED